MQGMGGCGAVGSGPEDLPASVYVQGYIHPLRHRVTGPGQLSVKYVELSLLVMSVVGFVA